MTNVQTQLPDTLARFARSVARRRKIPLEQIASMALSAQLTEWKLREDFETRARRGSWKKFDMAMSKVKDRPPQPGDEID
jgi:hypothetical protein